MSVFVMMYCDVFKLGTVYLELARGRGLGDLFSWFGPLPLKMSVHCPV